MKFSSIAYVSVVVFAGLALTIDGAFAAARCKSHSNTNNNRAAADSSAGGAAAPNAATGNGDQDRKTSKNILSDAWRQSNESGSCVTPNNGGQAAGMKGDMGHGATPDSSRSSVMPSVGGTPKRWFDGKQPRHACDYTAEIAEYWAVYNDKGRRMIPAAGAIQIQTVPVP